MPPGGEPDRTERRRSRRSALLALLSSLLFTAVMARLAYWNDPRVVKRAMLPPGFSFHLDAGQAGPGQRWVAELLPGEGRAGDARMTIAVNGIPIARLDPPVERTVIAVPPGVLKFGENRLQVFPSAGPLPFRLRLKNFHGYSGGLLQALLLDRTARLGRQWPGRPWFWVPFLLVVLVLNFSGWNSFRREGGRRALRQLAVHGIPLFFALLLILPRLTRLAAHIHAASALLLVLLHAACLHWTRIKPRWPLALGAACALGFAAFAWSIWSHAVDIPFSDDYDNVLGFANAWVQTDDAGLRGRMLLAQHNEHRLLVNRLATLAVMDLHGRIDFRLLILAGNIGLLVFCLALWWICRRSGFGLVAMAPAALLVFQPQYFECTTWAMASISNFWVLASTGISIACLQAERTRLFPPAVMAAAAASFCQGNGLLAFAAGAFLLWRQGRRRHLAAWLVAAALTALLYFAGYQAPANQPSLTGALQHPLAALEYLVTLVGGALAIRGLAFSAGIVLFALLAGLLVLKAWRSQPALFALLLFLHGTALLTAAGRFPLGLRQAVSSRYQLVSILIIALTCLLLQAAWPWPRLRHPAFAALLALSMGFSLLLHQSMRGPMGEHRRYLEEGIGQWRQNGVGLAYPDGARADAILRESIRLGVYRPPEP